MLQRRWIPLASASGILPRTTGTHPWTGGILPWIGGIFRGEYSAAIKAARKEYKESRKKVCDELYISPRYLTNIENKGQQPSLQVFYDLVTRYHISVDQFFFPNSDAEKSTNRRQLDALLDGMSDKGIRIVTATAKEIAEVEKAKD